MTDKVILDGFVADLELDGFPAHCQFENVGVLVGAEVSFTVSTPFQTQLVDDDEEHIIELLSGHDPALAFLKNPPSEEGFWIIVDEENGHRAEELYKGGSFRIIPTP